MKLDKYEKKRIVYVTAAVIFVFVCGIIYIMRDREEVKSYDIATVTEDCHEDDMPEDDDVSVIVYVTGAVKCPGVYEIGGNMRISDAIAAAGGFRKNAARDYLNLAALVLDGDMITVPTRKEVTEDTPGVSCNSSDSVPLVNINTAARDELMTLSGIGEAKADAIIAYRQENGNFKSKEELMQISGIKEGVYSRVSEYITVN